MNYQASENPLVREDTRIPFDMVRAEHVVPAVSEILKQARSDLEVLTSSEEEPDFGNTLGRMDDILERVKTRVAPLTHLISVAETPDLREAFHQVLPDITEFWSGITLNKELWTRLKDFSLTSEAAELEGLKKRHLKDTLREFRRSGADLTSKDKDMLASLRLEVSQLEQKFAENVLDATNTYSFLVNDPSELDGLPEENKTMAAQKAEASGQQGWLLTLDYPSFEPVMKYVENRGIRRELYVAYVTRCREGEFSNISVIEDLLNLRRKLARLLGYEDFTDYMLETRMAKKGETAFKFVSGLTNETKPYWDRDVALLKKHGHVLGLDDLQPWDIDFVREDLRSALFGIDDEITRPYFPIDRVMEGLFKLVEEVFGLLVVEKKISEVWHPEVKFYEVSKKNGNERLGCFYTDWHPREGKRQGAWMNDLKTGGPSVVGFRPHLAIIAGNLTPIKGNVPSLLTHREVQTVFHEFGHLLHHLASEVPIKPMAGINVAWDFVEVPSQLMENWTWEDEVLLLISSHFETAEPIPREIISQLRAGRQFMGGLNQMRQLALGHLDLRLHHDDPAIISTDLMGYIEQVMKPYSIHPKFGELHSTTIFSHLFAGGYASGYYSYLWSEVLEADIFGKFKENGVLNPHIGQDYMEAILTQGDSDDPENLFSQFMGRGVNRQALLDRNLGNLEPIN